VESCRDVVSDMQSRGSHSVVQSATSLQPYKLQHTNIGRTPSNAKWALRVKSPAPQNVISSFWPL